MSDNGSMADMALGCRSSLLNAILGLDKQESFASTKSRQRARHPWITLSRLVPPPERFVPMREHCTGHSVPRGLCLGAPSVRHPLPRGLCLGTPCMLQGWDILALLQQHPGAAFLQTGIRDSHVLHSQQGLWLLVWGSSRDGVPLCVGTESMWLYSFSASSTDCGGMTRAH